jgi:uncharacterized protein (TIGR02284 family)
MQTDDHAVKVLNGLIKTTIDSANGYRDAAEHIERSDCKTMFSERASRRNELARRLQDQVRSFGGDPETDQSALGKAHNKFVALKQAVTGGDSDKAVVDEVERGEDVIKARYQQALDDDDLPQSAREIVRDAYGSIKSDHDDISRLKHQLH